MVSGFPGPTPSPSTDPDRFTLEHSPESRPPPSPVLLPDQIGDLNPEDLRVWSPDQQHQPHMGIGWKCVFQCPT